MLHFPANSQPSDENPLWAIHVLPKHVGHTQWRYPNAYACLTPCESVTLTANFRDGYVPSFMVVPSVDTSQRVIPVCMQMC
jgi:hypothetical protein